MKKIISLLLLLLSILMYSQTSEKEKLIRLIEKDRSYKDVVNFKCNITYDETLKKIIVIDSTILDSKCCNIDKTIFKIDDIIKDSYVYELSKDPNGLMMIVIQIFTKNKAVEKTTFNENRQNCSTNSPKEYLNIISCFNNFKGNTVEECENYLEAVGKLLNLDKAKQKKLVVE